MSGCNVVKLVSLATINILHAWIGKNSFVDKQKVQMVLKSSVKFACKKFLPRQGSCNIFWVWHGWDIISQGAQKSCQHHTFFQRNKGLFLWSTAPFTVEELTDIQLYYFAQSKLESGFSFPGNRQTMAADILAVSRKFWTSGTFDRYRRALQNSSTWNQNGYVKQFVKVPGKIQTLSDIASLALSKNQNLQ